MSLAFVDFPWGDDPPANPAWQVKILTIKGRSPVTDLLDQLERSNRKEYKEMLKVVRMVATDDPRTRDQRKVRTSQNPAHHGKVKEMKAGNSRILFFYSDKHQSYVICTNADAKNSGPPQGASFDKCFQWLNFIEGKS